MSTEKLSVVIAKGRLFDRVRDRLADTDWMDADRSFSDRALRFDVSERLEVFVVRASDVPTFVAHGAADVGICGLDTILESGNDLIELLDLQLGVCRLCLCGPKGKGDQDIKIVATKFARLTEWVFAQKGRSAELVKLNGALEIAPLVGISDAIVDLVETGRTLEANGLEEYETLLDISTRAFTSRAALARRSADISEFIEALR